MLSHTADPNLVRWIIELSDGEPVEAVVIGEMGWGDYNAEDNPQWEAQQPHFGKVLSWSKAKPLLNYDFDSGYGSPRCNAIYAWTKSWVIAISQYDGSTSPFRIPRNPAEGLPEMPGG